MDMNLWNDKRVTYKVPFYPYIYGYFYEAFVIHSFDAHPSFIVYAGILGSELQNVLVL